MFCKGFLVISHCIARMVPRWQRRGQGFQLYTYAALINNIFPLRKYYWSINACPSQAFCHFQTLHSFYRDWFMNLALFQKKIFERFSFLCNFIKKKICELTFWARISISFLSFPLLEIKIQLKFAFFFLNLYIFFVC